MTDITMCRDTECPQKEQCYRFNAIKSEFWQSYFVESPRNEHDCAYFWPIEEKDEH